jgi:hypothetical protein
MTLDFMVFGNSIISLSMVLDKITQTLGELNLLRSIQIKIGLNGLHQAWINFLLLGHQLILIMT